MNKVRSTFCFLYLFLAFYNLCFAQSAYFSNYFGSNTTDAGRAITQFSNGDIYVAGYSAVGLNSTYDATVCKLFRDGSIAWTKFYGDSLNNYALSMNQTKDGKLIICGETEVSVFDKDAFVAKIDTDGTLLWYKQFGNFQNQTFRYVEATSDGGYIACGSTTDNSNVNDIYYLKLDSLGNQVWTGTIGGSYNDVGTAIHQLADGGFILTGDSNSNNASNYDVEVTRLDSAGGAIWDFAFGDTLTNGSQGILPLADGSFISYGETDPAPNQPFNFFMEKIDAVGTSIFRKTFGGPVSDALFSLIQDASGNFYFTGYSNSYHPGPIDMVFGKTDSAANLLWVQTFGDSSIDIGYQIIAAKDSGFYLFGNGYHNGDDDFLLVYAKDTLAGVGITEFLTPHKNIQTWPNPTKNSLQIVFNKTMNTPAKFTLYSLQGNLMFETSASCNGMSYNLQFPDNLLNGMYVLHAETNSATYYSKICIQK